MIVTKSGVNVLDVLVVVAVVVGLAIVINPLEPWDVACVTPTKPDEAAELADSAGEVPPICVTIVV